MKKTILFLFVIALLASCHTAKDLSGQRNLKDSLVTKYETKYKLIINDSVRITDSIRINADGSVSKYHSEKQSSTQKETLYKYCNINHHLTITKIIAVEKKLSWFENGFMILGKITSVLILLAALYFAVKIYFKFKPKIIV
ncbi:MAG: hypothetical protein WCJ61_15170 [Paludibacter sp.]